jgi:hypothetical protein
MYLAPVLGEKIGNASDGDSRRRKLMLDDVTAPKPAGAEYTLD